VTTFRGGAARAVLYSHFRSPIAQRRQVGFASSHFTRRALQVLHPVRTLDVLSRVLFGARFGPGVMMNEAATKGRLVAQRQRNVAVLKFCN
jgi:hypothetical protein